MAVEIQYNICGTRIITHAPLSKKDLARLSKTYDLTMASPAIRRHRILKSRLRNQILNTPLEI